MATRDIAMIPEDQFQEEMSADTAPVVDLRSFDGSTTLTSSSPVELSYAEVVSCYTRERIWPRRILLPIIFITLPPPTFSPSSLATPNFPSHNA